MSFNTYDQTLSTNKGSWICQHNERVFKVTGNSLDIISAFITQLATMLKERNNG